MKKFFYKLPKPTRHSIVKFIEFLATKYVKSKETQIKVLENKPSIKKNILIYHISGLSFGGTEKNLQMIAKYLDKDKYNVF